MGGTRLRKRSRRAARRPQHCVTKRRILRRNRDHIPSEENETEDKNEIIELSVSEDKIAGKSEVCGICLSDFETAEKVAVLRKCEHGFHYDCIQPWFRNHSSCPMCRSTLDENLFNLSYLDEDISTSDSDDDGAVNNNSQNQEDVSKLSLYELNRRQKIFERLGRFWNCDTDKCDEQKHVRFVSQAENYVFRKEGYESICWRVSILSLLNAIILNQKYEIRGRDAKIYLALNIFALYIAKAHSIVFQSYGQLCSIVSRGASVYETQAGVYILASWGVVLGTILIGVSCEIVPGDPLSSMCQHLSLSRTFAIIGMTFAITAIAMPFIEWEWWTWIDISKGKNRLRAGGFPPKSLKRLHPLVFTGRWPVGAHDENYWPCHFPRRDGQGLSFILKQRRRRRARKRRQTQIRSRNILIQNRINLAIEKWIELTGDRSAEKPELERWIERHSDVSRRPLSVAILELKRWIVHRGMKLSKERGRKPFETQMYQEVLNEFWLNQFEKWTPNPRILESEPEASPVMFAP